MDVTAREPVLVDFALQGGGSHGAFSWGVLDRLIEEPWLRIEAISDTSASAMNAALMTDGWMQGGAEGARAALDAYCHCHVDLARRRPCRPFRIILERVSFDQRWIT
jgi:NTE family protein